MNNNNQIKLTITDIIKYNGGIEQWNKGDIISISAGTGTGKSHFIKNSLHDYAKQSNSKILFLVHRLSCMNQFNNELVRDNKQDTIHIKTYQAIESLVKKKKHFDFTPYDYIVCDEFHYFISDSLFNKTTDLSLESIISQHDKTRIFMSATGNIMENYLKGFKKINVRKYTIQPNYDFINHLSFYSKDHTLEIIIENAINKKEKTIIFIDNAKKAFELHNKFRKHSIFNCSQNNYTYKKYISNEVNEIYEKEKFKSLILITTNAMDAGINIIDSDLKNVICDIRDIEVLIQCIGRKRIINPNDYINLTIKALSNQQIGRINSNLSKQFKHAKYLKNNDTEAYVNEYYRNLDVNNGIVYDELVNGKIEKKINMLAYYKYISDVVTFKGMIDKYGKYAYCKYMANKFNKRYSIIEEGNKVNELETYLENIAGKKLLKEEQKELIETIGLKDARGRLQKGFKSLNTYFEENKLRYTITPRKSGSVRFWKVYHTDNLGQLVDKAIK
ncbi:DEAD/DEAH box helicase family protein [Priestia aryabhattai]|uniref:DEAD/DEAH box helicase family protein n=1 Tax=Priestia aryabhattai TaxID=412384 RepID=UPI0015F40A0B|nr:DEAD/DEAH box helicase family protein [Priestia aryabhattai]